VLLTFAVFTRVSIFTSTYVVTRKSFIIASSLILTGAAQTGPNTLQEQQSLKMLKFLQYVLDSDSQYKYRSDSQDLGLRIYMVKLLQFRLLPTKWGTIYIYIHTLQNPMEDSWQM